MEASADLNDAWCGMAYTCRGKAYLELGKEFVDMFRIFVTLTVSFLVFYINGCAKVRKLEFIIYFTFYFMHPYRPKYVSLITGETYTDTPFQVNPLFYCFFICPTRFCSRANFMRIPHEKQKVRI